jgi:hypothetical protein
MENEFIDIKFLSSNEQKIPMPNNFKDILNIYDSIFNKNKIDQLKFYIINNKKKERIYLDELSNDQFKKEIINNKINNKLIVSVEEANLQNNKNFVNELKKCRKLINKMIKNNNYYYDNDIENMNKNDLIEEMNTKLNELKESIDSMSLQRINQNLSNKISEIENVFNQLTQIIQDTENKDDILEIELLKNKINEMNEENEKNKDIINQYKEKSEIQKEEIIKILAENYSEFYKNKMDEFLEGINHSFKEKMETFSNNLSN